MLAYMLAYMLTCMLAYILPCIYARIYASIYAVIHASTLLKGPRTREPRNPGPADPETCRAGDLGTRTWEPRTHRPGPVGQTWGPGPRDLDPSPRSVHANVIYASQHLKFVRDLSKQGIPCTATAELMLLGTFID